MLDIEQLDGQLNISYFDKDGSLQVKPYILPSSEMYEWEYVNPGEKSEPGIRSWDGKPVRKRRARFLSKWRIEEYLFKLPKHQTEDIYANTTPKKFFVDIEVFVGDEWPKPDTAKYPVTAITFCSGQKVVSLGIKPLSAEAIQRVHKRIEEHIKEKIEYSYLYFQNEYDMMYSFFYKAVQKMPLITGWNFTGYDWPYMINRCKRLNIDTSVASPSRKMYGEIGLPVHRLVIDYLDIYKKWDRVIDIKENNTLDFVARAALGGITKVKYNGTLQDLYENDWESYVFYNAVDTKLVEMIDRKLNTLSTFLTLGSITGVEANKAFSPIWMAEASIAREFFKRGKVFPRTEKQKKKKEGYEGAFVFEPNTGLYQWVTSFDFASLYPSIMRQWNISPESYIRNIQPGEQINPDEFIITSSGALFSKQEDSVFRTILTDYYGKRKLAKGKATVIEEEIEELKKYLK